MLMSTSLTCAELAAACDKQRAQGANSRPNAAPASHVSARIVSMSLIAGC
ncbi:hypothetical protein [Nonomuraea sp. NPDC049784]